MIEHINKQQYFRLVKKQPKYKNKIVKNALGKIENHSRGEYKFARDLYLELGAGKYKMVIEQIPFKLMVNGVFICKIIVDFQIIHKDGSVEFIEYKGAITNSWKIKWMLLQALHPEYTYTLVRHG